MSRRTLWVLAGLAIGFASASVRAEGVVEVAAIDNLSEEELTKAYQRLPRERFYRHASHLYDQVIRYTRMPRDSMSLQDQFMQAYYQGRWDEVRRVVDALPEKLADDVYNKMLSDLTDRYTPIMSLDDFFGLADASPSVLTSGDRIQRLAKVLQAAVPKEQQRWLHDSLQKGSRYLGKADNQQLTTGRVLMHADFDELAKQYLPDAAEASQLDDSQGRRDILAFWDAQGQIEDFQQSRVAKLWQEQADTLNDANQSDREQQRAAGRLAELMARVEPEVLRPWIAELASDNEASLLLLASTFGRKAHGSLNNRETEIRANNLQVQQVLLDVVDDKYELSEPPWQPIAVAMADWWIQEAGHTFEYAPSYRSEGRPRPHVTPAEIFDSAPGDDWTAALPDSLQERIDVSMSRAVLVSDQYERAGELISKLGKRNPQAAATLVEEYLRAWADRHDPHVPEEVRKEHQLPSDARIMVTPLMMQKNIAQLAEMMEFFREQGIRPRNVNVLVDAFDVCYSDAEVYRRGDIEKVFGPIATMDEDVLHQTLETMVAGLASRWRDIEVQEESGTRRTFDDVVEMIREGYATALEIVDRRVAEQPESWRMWTLGGSLLSDWADFEYLQQLVAQDRADRMEAFREKNLQADRYFSRAAETYGEQVRQMSPGQYSIEPYLAWFHALLGINRGGQLNLSKPLDRQALQRIRKFLRQLPGDTAKPHLDRLAKHVTARLEDTDNPLHEELKYKYSAGALVLIDESPFSFEAAERVDYYDELLDEIRLETRTDGPNTIYRDDDFGIILSVRHTEAMGRMADFGKYLVNEAKPSTSFAKKRTKLSPQAMRMSQVQGRRDMLEASIDEALAPFFDVHSITFSPRDVQPRDTEQPGWQETVLAYVHCRAKDASVDKIPRIQMNLEFLDMTGPVTILAESAETMIKVTVEPTPPRPFGQADLTAVLDARQLDGSGQVTVQYEATTNGLVPDLEHLIDVESFGRILPVANIQPLDETMVQKLNSWAETVHVVSQRRWLVTLDASALIDPPRQTTLHLPVPLMENASITYRKYEDMDLVDLSEPVAVIGPGDVALEPIREANQSPAVVIVAAIATGIVVLGLIGFLLRSRRRDPATPRAADVHAVPATIDGFSAVKYLRSLENSPLVQLNEQQRAQLQSDIRRIQTGVFASTGDAFSKDELVALSNRWYRVIR